MSGSKIARTQKLGGSKFYLQDLKVNRRKNRLLFNYREIPDSVACNFILSGKDISSNCLISMITVSYSQLDGWVPVRQSIKTESKCIGFQTQFLNNFIPTVFSIIFTGPSVRVQIRVKSVHYLGLESRVKPGENRLRLNYEPGEILSQ